MADSAVIPILRPWSKESGLQHGTMMVRRAVQLIDDGQTDFKVMLSTLMAGVAENGGDQQPLARYALMLQGVFDDSGNYLARLFFHLYKDAENVAAGFLKMLAKQGVMVSPDSGYFEDLTQMDPRLPIPAEFVDPQVGAIGYERYLDGFSDWHYDLDYRPALRGKLSRVLQLHYSDGRRLDVDYQVICDDFDSAAMLSLMRSRIGPAGIAIPARISRGTTPRLFAAKQDVLHRLGRYNDQFKQFVTVTLMALAQVLPFGGVGQVVPLRQMFPARVIGAQSARFAKPQIGLAETRPASALTTDSRAVSPLGRAQTAPITVADRGTPETARAVEARLTAAAASQTLAAEQRVVNQIVDTVEERSAQRAINDQAFMALLDRGRKGITDAGTRFHNLAKEETQLLVKEGNIPAGYQVVAEQVIGSGAGSSRIDLLISTPSGRPFEFDWKTSILSGLARKVRELEMPKHAIAIRGLGVELAGQESRSWGPAVVRMLRRAGRIGSLTPEQLKALAPWL